MKHDDYFQFPLCALAYEGDIRTRLNAIIDYALIEAGAKLFQKLTVGQRQEFINTQRREGKLPHNFDASNWDYNAVLYGASILRVNYHGNYDSALRWHKSLSKFIRSFEGEHGRDALVRIKQAWLFKTRDGKGITYREFSVLCAIFSALGDKKMVIVTRHRVVRCALGYRKRLILDSELSRRKDKASPLTERQVRDTIDRLHRNKFFARATVSRRFTY